MRREVGWAVWLGNSSGVGVALDVVGVRVRAAHMVMPSSIAYLILMIVGISITIDLLQIQNEGSGTVCLIFQKGFQQNILLFVGQKLIEDLIMYLQPKTSILPDPSGAYIPSSFHRRLHYLRCI